MTRDCPPTRTSIRWMYVRGLALSFAALFRRPHSFRFGNQSLLYFRHSYNWTWMNERCVEIPIARHAISGVSSERILEVGNVISHYSEGVTHEVVDRYERAGARVKNVDAIQFHPSRDYELIVSISTLEHVGWDETPRNPAKAWDTLLHLRSLLAPGGTLLVTIPAGYHPELAGQLNRFGNDLGTVRGLHRRSAANEWVECDPSEATAQAFGKPYPFANALLILTSGSDPFSNPTRSLQASEEGR